MWRVQHGASQELGSTSSDVVSKSGPPGSLLLKGASRKGGMKTTQKGGKLLWNTPIVSVSQKRRLVC